MNHLFAMSRHKIISRGGPVFVPLRTWGSFHSYRLVMQVIIITNIILCINHSELLQIMMMI